MASNGACLLYALLLLRFSYGEFVRDEVDSSVPFHFPDSDLESLRSEALAWVSKHVRGNRRREKTFKDYMKKSVDDWEAEMSAKSLTVYYHFEEGTLAVPCLYNEGSRSGC